MPDINDISAILGLLSQPSSENEGEQSDKSSENTDNGGFFGSIDPEMLIKLMEVFSRLNETDKNAELILALKPHLRQENRPKADRAAELVKLMSVLSVFGENSLF